MAKSNEPKVELERTYNVPLRKEFLKAPRYRRSKRAVAAFRAFIVKHMKSDNVKIGKYCNEAIWTNGIKNPPHHVKVNASKYDDGSVRVELVGAPLKGAEKKPAKQKKEIAKSKVKQEETQKEAKKPAKEIKEDKKEE